MRRIITICLLLFQIIASCQKAVENDEIKGDVRSFSTITAHVNETTKTELDLVGKKMVWRAGDQILVQDRNNLGNKLTFTLDPAYDGLSTGVFRLYDSNGNIDENAGITAAEFNIIYLNKREQDILNWGSECTVSVLSNQVYVAEGIEESIIPMTAYSTNLANVSFKCQSSILSLNLVNNGDLAKRLQSIELSSNDYISGNIFIDIKNNTRERATSDYESWTTGDNPILSQKKSVNLSFGSGLTIGSGETKRINIVVARNSYQSLKYSITYLEGDETKKCIISSDKRTIDTNGGETVLLGTQEITQSFENLIFKVNGTSYADYDFRKVVLTKGDKVEIRSKNISGTEEVLSKEETLAALRMIGAKHTKVSIDFSNVKAGYPTITSDIFSEVKNYIEDFYFPKDVVTINTFKQLGNMGNIYLNNGLQTINGGGPGFYGQTMETIYIPASVKSIGTANFEHASGIVVDEGNPNYWTDGVSLYTLKEVDGVNKPYLLSSICGRADLSSSNGVYEIPESVIGHLQYAQDYAVNIKTLIIPKGFYSIASAHLRYCANLSCLRFKSTRSLFAWSRSSEMPVNGTIEIVIPDGSTDNEVNNSINSYYGNYKSWVTAGWTIKAVSPDGKVLKTLTAATIEDLIIVNEDEDLF